jgi:hypothetical protein
MYIKKSKLFYGYHIYNWGKWKRCFNKLGGSSADWLTVVYAMGVTTHFYCSNYISNNFIIEIRHLGGLWYMANIPQLRALSRHSALRHAKNSPQPWYIGHIPHPLWPCCWTVTPPMDAYRDSLSHFDNGFCLTFLRFKGKGNMRTRNVF